MTSPENTLRGNDAADEEATSPRQGSHDEGSKAAVAGGEAAFATLALGAAGTGAEQYSHHVAASSAAAAVSGSANCGVASDLPLENSLEHMQRHWEELRSAFHRLEGACTEQIRRIHEERDLLRYREACSVQRWSALQAKQPLQRIRLNVGGQLFETSAATLSRCSGSMLEVVVSGHFPLERDADGNVFIDRDPALFRQVMQYLRTGEVTGLPRSGTEGALLRQEAKFYGIDCLVVELSADRMRWESQTKKNCIAGALPTARCFAACQYVGGDTMFMFGGCTATDVFFDTMVRVQIVSEVPLSAAAPAETVTPSSTHPVASSASAATPPKEPSPPTVPTATAANDSVASNDSQLPSALDVEPKYIFSTIKENYGQKPRARSGHTLTLVDDVLLLCYGNDNSSMAEDAHIFDIDGMGWTELKFSGDVVRARSGHTINVVHNVLYLIGGKQIFPAMQCFGDVFEGHLDKARHELCWREMKVRGDEVEKRAYHSSAVYQDKIYIYGGIVNDIYSKGLASFDLQTRTWTVITSANTPGYVPSLPRSGHVAFVYQDRMYVFGSYAEDGPDLALYQYSFMTNSWSRVTTHGRAPPKRAAPSGAFVGPSTGHPRMPFLFVFGGFDIALRKCYNDVFTIAL